MSKKQTKDEKRRAREARLMAKYRARAAARPLPSIMQGDRRRALLATVSLLIVFVAVVSAVIACLLETPSELHPERGAATFHLFTVFSNCVSALACFLSLPFAVEGIRKNRYDIPEWCLTLHYAGAVSVCITMIFTFCFIFPFKGPELAFGGPNLFMHVICPILCICTFLFLESEHRMTMVNTLVSLIPFAAYAVVYYINVVVLGEAGGGWRDIYMLNTMVPLWVSMPMMILLAFGVSKALGALHNVISMRQAAIDERLAIAFSPKADEDTLDGQIALLAEQRVAKGYAGSYIAIPEAALADLGHKFGDEHTVDNMCRLYLDCYLEARKSKEG